MQEAVMQRPDENAGLELMVAVDAHLMVQSNRLDIACFELLREFDPAHKVLIGWSPRVCYEVIKAAPVLDVDERIPCSRPCTLRCQSTNNILAEHMLKYCRVPKCHM